jgi:hypothetical protein
MKTDSLRLNSRAMSCSWVCERETDEGTRMMARGLPAKGVEVKTSRVMNVREVGAMIAGSREFWTAWNLSPQVKTFTLNFRSGDVERLWGFENGVRPYTYWQARS